MLRCVDGLRGLAVAMVILFHLHEGLLTLPGGGTAVRAAFRPFRFGFIGVDLFLVLSGFCLANSHLRRARAGTTPGLGRYLKARWRRIGPPYYIAMALYLSVPAIGLALGYTGPAAKDLTARQIGVHLAFLHGLWPDTTAAINVSFWSLSLEFQFYLAMPILMIAATRWGVVPMLTLVAASSALFRFWLSGRGPSLSHLESGLFLSRWTEFALGIGVAYWHDRPGRALASGLTEAASAAAGVAALGAGVAMYAHDVPIAPDFALGVGFAALLAAALASSERGGPLGKHLSRSGWVALGAVSYSLYLTHNLPTERAIQFYGRRVSTPSAATDAVLAVTVLAAVGMTGWAFYSAVERRFVRSVGTGGAIPEPVAPETAAPSMVATADDVLESSGHPVGN